MIEPLSLPTYDNDDDDGSMSDSVGFAVNVKGKSFSIQFIWIITMPAQIAEAKQMKNKFLHLSLISVAA
jgi:hypothetical protein